MKGRTPTPTHLRAITGNAGKRTTETHEPEPAADPDKDPPDHLDHWGREIWNRLYPELAKSVGISVLDRPKLEIFCESFSRYKQADDALWAIVRNPATGEEKTVRSYTYKTTGRNGVQIKTRPEYHQLHEEVRLMDRIGAEFGLSPAARVRLRGLGQGKLFDDDELDRINQDFGGPRRLAT